jgi:hypothetical protein
MVVKIILERGVCMLVLLNELYGMSERNKGRQRAEGACWY